MTTKTKEASRKNHAVIERKDGRGALCGSLSIEDTLLRRKHVTCGDCLVAMASLGYAKAADGEPELLAVLISMKAKSAIAQAESI